MVCIYACDDCGFLFQRSIEVSECPSCEKKHIRPATEQESAQLVQILQEEAKKTYKRRKV